jgi:hypothetical protein
MIQTNYSKTQFPYKYLCDSNSGRGRNMCVANGILKNIFISAVIFYNIQIINSSFGLKLDTLKIKLYTAIFEEFY